MYHYVRDLQNSAYPRIKGLDIAAFRRQLDFLDEKYSFVSIEELKAFIKDASPLPSNACWLTFDDGYLDHYENVFPELLSRGIRGGFFAPVKPVAERELLDVNKVHFILASVDAVSILVDELKSLCLASDLSSVTGRSFDEYWKEIAKPNRFDGADTVFVKRMLQFALPEKWRRTFSDVLFKKHVSTDARAFADELYMSQSQLSEMVNAGMYVGSHGYRHLWLGKETRQAQSDEIQRSLAFLEGIGAPTVDWVMCYPYGDYNEDTLNIVGGLGGLAGLSTKVGVADLRRDLQLELPRLDTNDLPH